MTGTIERPASLESGAQRTRVLQYLAIYAGAAVGFLQLLDVVIDRLGVAPRIFAFGVILCALGAPLAAAAALLSDIRRREQVAPVVRRGRPSRAAAIALVLLFLAFAALIIVPRAAAHFAAVPAGSHTRVMIAGFATAPPDSALGRALTEALRIDFARAEGIALVDPRALREVLAFEGMEGDVVAGEIAATIASRVGAAAFIAPEAHRSGASVLLLGRILDHAGNPLFATRQSSTAADDVWAALDRLSHDLRAATRSLRLTREPYSPIGIQPHALQLYARGVRARRAGDTHAAEQAFTAALTADSSLIPARRELGELYYARGDTAAVAAALTAAHDRISRLSGRERFLTLAAYHQYVRNDSARTSVSLRRILGAEPGDSATRVRLARLRG